MSTDVKAQIETLMFNLKKAENLLNELNKPADAIAKSEERPKVDERSKKLYRIHKYLFAAKFTLTLMPSKDIDDSLKTTISKRLQTIENGLMSNSPIAKTGAFAQSISVTVNSNNESQPTHDKFKKRNHSRF